MNVLKNRKKEAEKKTKKDPKKKEKKNQDDDEDDGIKIKAATKVKEVEEEDKVVENTEEKAIGQQVSTANVTWEETKEMDQQEVNKNNLEDVKQEETAKPVKASWVPQMAKKEDVASNFKADDVYMPGLNDPDAIKNAPKEAPKKVVQQQSVLARPMFTNSKKIDNSGPLQMSAQQLKEQEMDAKLNRVYGNTEGGADQQNAGGDSGIKFSGGPMKFSSAGTQNKNSLPIEMTAQQKKEIEMEEKLMKNRSYKTERPAEGETQAGDQEGEQTIQFKAQPFKMSGGAKKVDNSAPLQLTVQQQKEIEAEEKLQKQKENAFQNKQEPQTQEQSEGSTEAYKPRFGGGAQKQKEFKPLEKTEQQKKIEEMEAKKGGQPQVQSQEQPQEESKRPAMRFTNAKKQDKEFKPLEKTEQQKKMEEVEKQLQLDAEKREKEYQEKRAKRDNNNNNNRQQRSNKKQNNPEEEQQNNKKEEQGEDGWKVI